MNSLLQKKTSFFFANCEAAKASKTDTNLEKFNGDQCNGTNSSEKGWKQHMWMKQYPSVDFRHDNFYHCSQVYKKNPEGQEKV